MARKNVVTIDTNVTPEQAEAIEHVRAMFGVNRAHLVRMALAQFVERNNGAWPNAEIKRGVKAIPPNNQGVEN